MYVNKHFLCVCVCVCVCVCMCVCVCVCVCSHRSMSEVLLPFCRDRVSQCPETHYLGQACWTGNIRDHPIFLLAQ